jgi:hypothetical protein
MARSTQVLLACTASKPLQVLLHDSQSSSHSVLAAVCFIMTFTFCCYPVTAAVGYPTQPTQPTRCPA